MAQTSYMTSNVAKHIVKKTETIDNRTSHDEIAIATAYIVLQKQLST